MSVVLVVSKEKFLDQLAKQWAQGKLIEARYTPGDVDYKSFALLKREFDLWDSYNDAWLGHAFADMPFPEEPNQIQAEYRRAGALNTDRASAIKRGMAPDTLPFKYKYFESWLLPKIDFLDGLRQKIDFISVYIPSLPPSHSESGPAASLTHLHPTIQQAAGSRFDSAHYADAISAACTALDKAVAAKAQRPDLNGKQLMDVAFTPKNPLVRLSGNDNEQTGFMLLYQGSVQAIRNHYAHNLTEIPAPRALEWLSFISALFYKLDEAQPPAMPTTA